MNHAYIRLSSGDNVAVSSEDAVSTEGALVAGRPSVLVRDLNAKNWERTINTSHIMYVSWEKKDDNDRMSHM